MSKLSIQSLETAMNMLSEDDKKEFIRRLLEGMWISDTCSKSEIIVFASTEENARSKIMATESWRKTFGNPYIQPFIAVGCYICGITGCEHRVMKYDDVTEEQWDKINRGYLADQPDGLLIDKLTDKYEFYL